MPDILRIARWAGMVALVVVYAALVHHVNAEAQVSFLAAILAVAPLFAIGFALVWNAPSRLIGYILLGIASIACWTLWPLIARHAGFMFWVQDVSLLLGLLIMFGRTLLAGRKPLCVYFAEKIHGSLSPAHEKYAHQVTIAWVVFFGAMATISTLLFFLAPLASWSVFVNFLLLPLVALMFVVEFLVRRQVLSDAGAGHILDAVQAYFKRTH